MKVQKMYDVPGCPVISNRGTPTEKCQNNWITTRNP